MGFGTTLTHRALVAGRHTPSDLAAIQALGRPLDWPRPGASRRDLPAVGPVHLGCPSPPAASGAQQAATNRYIAEHNDRPKLFVCTKLAAILDAVNGNAAPSE